MKGWIDRQLRQILRRGVRDGLLAGDGLWLALGALAWLGRFLLKTREPEIVREKLAVGQTIIVTNLGPPLSRRAARTARRAGAADPAAGDAAAAGE